jgi:hypothetical protein
MRIAAALTVVVCGLAGYGIAKDIAVVNPAGAVDFIATVAAVREVPAGNPLPGIHLDANVKGRMTDIYIAPADFAAKYEVKVAKGDAVRIVGTQAGDVILARELNVGSYNKINNLFRTKLTVYLRNDDGPFWMDAPVN